MIESAGFGLTAHKERRGDNWLVYLPHQCDTWDIAGDGNDGVPREEAVADLEQFIAEATQALNALREGREVGEKPEWWEFDDD